MLEFLDFIATKADTAINQEDFDTLIDIYANDAVLVTQPGMNAVGKELIRKAFEAIAAHFEHTLNARQSATYWWFSNTVGAGHDIHNFRKR